MKIVKAFLPLLMVMILTGACQKTPEKKTVIGKNKDIVAEIDKYNSSKFEKYKAPETLKETITAKNGALIVEIDAIIENSNVTKYPIYQISPLELSQELMDKYIKTLMQDQEIFEPKEIYTKTEINQEIYKLKEAISDPNSDLNQFKNTNPSGYQDSLTWYNSKIKELENKRKTAPDNYAPKKSSGAFTDPKSGDGFIVSEPSKIINITAKLPNGNQANLKVNKFTSTGKNSRINFDSYTNDQTGPIGKIEKATDKINGLNISLTEARTKARDFVANLGIQHMDVSAEGSIPGGISGIMYDNSITYEKLPRYFQFYFTKAFDGLKTNYVKTNTLKTKEQKEYSAPWPDESLKLTVDNHGVIDFDYQSPTTKDKKISENVKLLSFSDIIERFKKHTEVSMAFSEDPEVVSRKINIHTISLGYARVPVKNNLNIGLLVPVFDFYGTCTDFYSKETKDSEIRNNNFKLIDDTFARSYLTINALDGSIVERFN